MVKIRKNIKAIIFDFEKTLVNLNLNWDPLRKTNSEIFKKYGFEIDYKLLRPVFERTAEELKKIEDSNTSEEKVLQILNDLLKAQKEFEEKSLHKSTIFPDSKSFINFVTGKGLKTAILSSNLSSTVKKIFSRSGILFNGPIVGREDVIYPKPELEGLNKILKQLNVQGGDCILIGDTDFDMDIAKKANCLAVLIKRNPESQTIPTKADLEIHSLSELTF